MCLFGLLAIINLWHHFVQTFFMPACTCILKRVTFFWWWGFGDLPVCLCLLRNLYLIIFIRKKTAYVLFASNFLNDLHVCQLFWASLTYQKNEQKSSADYILNLCSLDFFLSELYTEYHNSSRVWDLHVKFEE